MEKIYHSLAELIGHTPLLEISHIEKEEQLKARVLVKLESFNPGGSVKDRAALSLIETAERDGRLRQPATEAKAARGTFIRWCAERGVTSTEELREFAERGYALDPNASDRSTLTFVRI